MQRPNDARARPSSLLKRDDDYTTIFSSGQPIELYLVAAKLIKTAQSYLRGRDDLQPKDKNNIVFYVAMYAASRLTGKARPTVKELSGIAPEKIDAATIEASVKVVEEEYIALGASDVVAKGSGLVAKLLERRRTEEYPTKK